MAQNELQEMISRYQKELLQYARSSKQSSASPSATTPSAASPSVTNKSPVSPSVTNKSTPPEPTSRDLDQKYDQMNTDFDQIESDFDQIDGDFATEELRGYFSAYPEDDIDQMSFPNIDAAQNPITAQNPSFRTDRHHSFQSRRRHTSRFRARNRAAVCRLFGGDGAYG